MKKTILVCLSILICFGCLTVQAAENIQTPVVLCSADPVYALDLVYSVPAGASVSRVTCTVSGCMYDWNYVASEAKLYVSFASATPLPQSAALAQITATAPVSLKSMLADGIARENVYASHKEVIVPAAAPTWCTTGTTGGSTCERCGAVLQKDTLLPPTGPDYVLPDTGFIVAGGFYDIGTVPNAVVTPVSRTESVISLPADVDNDGVYEMLSAYADGLSLHCSGVTADATYTIQLVSDEDATVLYSETLMAAGNTLSCTLWPSFPDKTGSMSLRITSNAPGFAAVRIPVHYAVFGRYNTSDYMMGDVNFDGCVDLRDIIVLTSDAVFGRSYETAQNKSADVNGDLCFDLQDLIVITSDEHFGKNLS